MSRGGSFGDMDNEYLLNKTVGATTPSAFLDIVLPEILETGSKLLTYIGLGHVPPHHSVGVEIIGVLADGILHHP